MYIVLKIRNFFDKIIVNSSLGFSVVLEAQRVLCFRRVTVTFSADFYVSVHFLLKIQNNHLVVVLVISVPSSLP